MIIQNMFEEDINRPINGVIKVDQDELGVIEQEVKEYVITKELKKHFISFFNYYSDSFDRPTSDMGVWISGFFGSGKSHFLKMLSYILENRNIGGVKTVEFFRKKFESDPATFMMIDKATRGETETILFNIDIEGFSNKDKTAVLRVFAKMFYNHLGLYGEDLKVAKLEQFIAKQGKTDEFRRVFEQKNGSPWVESRDAYAFFEDDVVDTLTAVLGMSETAARNWFNGTETAEISIAQLVSEIKDYVDSKPDNFRLLFMVDEVGQYIGTSTDLLLNLQSLVEELGAKCNGKVWVCCTGQEAINEIIKVRNDEFSRIQARFKTRLSLTSSSVDEVIQERILKKKPEAKAELMEVYNQNDSVLRNLFSFKKDDALLDIKGFSGPEEFANNFPFVPYQFIIMQKVFAEIRKHGNSGKHLSGGERSMLSGFQEAVQKLQEKDEYALVPFFRFYDTVHTFLEGSIRRVIERCQKAADNANGIEAQDVDVLKLLYLIRYIDSDIRGTIDNIVILMADDIRADKVILREGIKKSLDRLLSQNYIGRSGDTYNFLTDEEQRIQEDINVITVDTANIVERISQKIYGEIYTTKKFRYKKYDFAFDQYVDNVMTGAPTGGMRLRFMTVNTDIEKKNDLYLMPASNGEAIVVLEESNYYENFEKAMKIRKYVKQQNVTELSKAVQNIIANQQKEASKYEDEALEELKKAIVNAQFYVDGEHIEIKSGDAKSKIDQALEYLVSHVYSNLDLITDNAESDADVMEVLSGAKSYIQGTEPNRDAAAKMEEYLETQHRRNLPTSMADVQSRYQAIPYGWREIDIAYVAAMLIYQQKVTIKYGGATIQPDNPKLPDMLRKKSEIGKTSISKRQVVTAAKMKAVKEIMRDYFDMMNVKDDEDGLVKEIVDKFNEQKTHFEELLKKYEKNSHYPDRAVVSNGLTIVDSILSQSKDNIALIDRVLTQEDSLFENKEKMQRVEGFFRNQVQVFDDAVQLERDLHNELDYLSKEEEANKALNQIRLITMTDHGFDYRKIPDLNGLIATVHEGHDRLLAVKREELLEIVRQCMEAVHSAGNSNSDSKEIITRADTFYSQYKTKIADLKSLALLDGLVPPMIQYKDTTVDRIEGLNRVKEVPQPSTVREPAGNYGTEKPSQPKKIIKSLNRQVVFPAKRLESESDVDEYVEKMRTQLKQLMKNCDGIQLN